MKANSMKTIGKRLTFLILIMCVAKQQETNNQTAREWLLDYENRNLYQ